VYEIRLHPEAARAFSRLHGVVRDRIVSAIDGLATDPRSSTADTIR